MHLPFQRTARAALVALVSFGLLASGCAFMADLTAPRKAVPPERTTAALDADAQFWSTLHGGRYDRIDATVRALQLAYLAAPGDAVTASHIGFMRAWQASEAARAPSPDPATTDQIALARRYFAEAHSLAPDEARIHGFLAGMTLAEGTIHQDERLTRKGYYQLRRAIDAWPEFNLFTGGYVMSRLAAGSERFVEGLAWQWRTLDLCAGEKVDRAHPDYARYLTRYTTTGPQRVCWNGWIAPHNVEGFFLNMGDMLVKAGDWQTALRIYANAKTSPDYARWPYRDVLERRIANARDNVARFNAPEPAPDATDHRILIQSPFACMACHQKSGATPN